MKFSFTWWRGPADGSSGVCCNASVDAVLFSAVGNFVPKNMNVLSRRVPILLSLLKVQELGSINKAADALHISQPSLTRNIARLEKSLGIRIFERNAKGVFLTSFGTALVEHAHRIEGELRNALETVDALKGSSSAVLRIGASPLVLTQFLPTALEALRRDFPLVSVKVIEGPRPVLLERLRHLDIDVAVVTLPPEWEEPGIVANPLFELNPNVVVRAGHPLARKPDLTLRELANWQWILPRTNGSVYEHILRTFRRARVELPSYSIELGSPDAIKALLLSTDLLAVLPVQIVAKELRTQAIDVPKWRLDLF